MWKILWHPEKHARKATFAPFKSIFRTRRICFKDIPNWFSVLLEAS
jgi:hypothetical protein